MKEVVIKMSDEMYDWFINGFPDKADMDELQRLVITGTVLPKGHGDLKDANNFFNDELDEKLAECKVEQNIFKDNVYVKDIIKYAPTVIEADKEVNNNASNFRNDY